MVKNNPRIKENITTVDRINAIEFIAGMYFTENNETGEVKYTPYYSEIAKVNAAMRYFIDGVESDDSEDIYESVMNDKKLNNLYDGLCPIMTDIMKNVHEIVEYRKQENLAKLQSDSNSILVYKMLELMEQDSEKKQLEIENNVALKEWLQSQKEINEIITPDMQKRFVENFDVNEIMDAMVDKFGESELHQKNKELVSANRQIREKDNKIIELQNDYARAEQKENVKNVLGDKPKKKRGRPAGSKNKANGTDKKAEG